MMIGYVKVSLIGQYLEKQLNNLNIWYGEYFTEKHSG